MLTFQNNIESAYLKGFQYFDWEDWLFQFGIKGKGLANHCCSMP